MNKPTKMNPHARHKARRLALQAIYQWQSAQHSVQNIFTQFMAEQDIKNADVDYFKELLENIAVQADALDEHCKAYLDRSIKELDPIELAILRIAIYEFTQHPEIPYRVVINEAVELAKKFGATDGHKYVNGVLDKVAKEIRKTEVVTSRN